MKRAFIFLIVLFSIEVGAVELRDEWLCTATGISRNANVIDSCGVGESHSETAARAAALTASMEEFNIICKASADCDVKNVSVVPKRMSCTAWSNGMWKCYRLVEFVLGK